MRELLVDTCTGEEEDGTAHSFQYYILVDEMELGGGLSCESYGVKVAGPDGEEASVPNITVSSGYYQFCSQFFQKGSGLKRIQIGRAHV